MDETGWGSYVDGRFFEDFERLLLPKLILLLFSICSYISLNRSRCARSNRAYGFSSIKVLLKLPLLTTHCVHWL